MTARDRHRAARRLKRETGSRAPFRTIRVYAEGKATEPEYLSALKRHPALEEGVAVRIEIIQVGATPLTLVDYARGDMPHSDLDFDEYWCVFDVESPNQHPHLQRACELARSHGIKLAISNPCFELWLILHHADQTAFLTTKEAEALRRRLDGSDGKHLDPSLYSGRVGQAVVRAKRLREKHELDGSRFPADNPSSTVFAFVEELFGRDYFAA